MVNIGILKSKWICQDICYLKKCLCLHAFVSMLHPYTMCTHAQSNYLMVHDKLTKIFILNYFTH